MKILILSRYQNKSHRVVESVVYELSKRLSENHQVDILSGQDSDSFQKMVKSEYDVVMPMNGRMQSLKASIGRLIGGYKLVIGGHSGIGRDDIWNIVFCKPDIFIALTGYMANWAKKWAWGSKVIKINDGVDTKKFSPSGKKINFNLPRPIVLSVGALEWYKYHERVINAMDIFNRGSLIIVGDGMDKQRLEKLGGEKLGKRFKIIQAKYKDMPKIYRSADVFTLPSWDREAFGVVYLEALATGVPVVAPDDPSRREIIGEAGIFTDVTDAAKYAVAIQEALNKKWGNIRREQAEKFSWENITKEYENCLENL